ncbi:MAG: hypothetical protein GY782_04340 [Gammaproteobacteria bacterium]|nr:hypothetical protein [Gammaproteobacteria bacterium]
MRELFILNIAAVIAGKRKMDATPYPFLFPIPIRSTPFILPITVIIWLHRKINRNWIMDLVKITLMDEEVK